MSPSDFSWTREAGRITCRDGAGAVVCDDSFDHWKHAVCRLLNLTEAQAARWIEASANAAGASFAGLGAEARIQALRAGARAVLGEPVSPAANPVAADFPDLNVFGEPIDRVWISGIREDASVAVVGASHLGHGILARTPACGGGAVPPTVYEEAYFEGKTYGLGYGDYKEQMGWRMEKSTRQVRQLEGIAQWIGVPFSAATRVLDVGSGYGYFRQALAGRGYGQAGLDVSRYAAAVAREEFGFETFIGSLEEYAVQRGGERFDLITLFDTIEHVADPLALIQAAAGLLNPGGLVAVRTPNLPAVEFDVFGRYYHSLKMEHLHYFSARSLARCFELASLVPQFLTTEAHLLNGVLGVSAVQSHARTLRGSDLFAVGQRPA